MKNNKQNRNSKQNNFNFSLVSAMLVSVPLLSALLILISANSEGLDMIFDILDFLSNGFGFQSDYSWIWRLALLLPVISVVHYIGFVMLKNETLSFDIQILKSSVQMLFIALVSCFLVGVGMVIAVYLSKAYSFMHFYGSPLARLDTLTNSSSYIKAYELLESYIWANLIVFYITVAIVSIVHIVLCKTLYANKIEPFFSEYISDKALSNKKSEGLKSSEEELKELELRLKKMKPLEPAKHFQKGHTFIARDIDANKPIFINDNEITDKKLAHVAIVGASGSGKGVFSQSFLVQMILKSYPVIVFDPNEDEHVMKNLKHNAEKMGKNFHWINFKEYNKPQIDILQNCDAYEFRELTNCLFPNLKIKDSDGNYYAQFSRRVRTSFYEKELDGVSCMYDLHKRVFDKYGEDALKDEQGNLPQFVQEFIDFANIPMFKVKESLSIADAIQNGDVIYISCPEMSSDDEITYLCKAFFIRVLQIIKNRNPDTAKQVFLFVDEFAEFVNKTVKTAIEQVRKKGCTMLMNMTSFESLDAIDTDVKSSAVITTVKNNSLKLIYQQPHEELSAKASKMTGEKIIKVERQHIKRNEALKELDQVAETIQMSQKTNVFSATLLENLPPKVGVFIGKGLPKLVQTEVLKYPADTKYPTLIEATPYQEDKKPTESNDIMEAL